MTAAGPAPRRQGLRHSRAGAAAGFFAVGITTAVSAASPATTTVTQHYSLAASAFTPDGPHHGAS